MSVWEGSGAPVDACQYQRFSMLYAPQGSVPLVEGSRHALISVAASSDRLRESAISDRWTALMIPLNMFRLWQGFRRKSYLLLINQMESGDIQRGQGGRLRLMGAGSKVLRVWNLVLSLLNSLAGRSLSRNYLLPLRYRARQRVGRRSSRALRVKWSNKKLRMLRIPTSLKRRRSVPRM